MRARGVSSFVSCADTCKPGCVRIPHQESLHMSKPLNANVVTLQVNGHPMQNLQAGQKLRFSAKANERYRLVKKSGQSDELLSGALATRHGLDLQLDELNGVQVVIENFFQILGDHKNSKYFYLKNPRFSRYAI